MPPKVPVLLNAVHTSGGGGLVYLQGVLPSLAADKHLEWHLLIPSAGLAQLKLPSAFKVHVAPTLPFGVNHVWEQLAIPVLARMWGCKATLSNANYGPLFAPRAGVIVHTTTRAGCAWRGLYWRVYWAVVHALTVVCLWRKGPHACVAPLVAAEYTSPQKAATFAWAPSGVDVSAVPQGLKRDPNLILAVGDMYPHKNYPLLLQALAKLREVRPKARLLIIGRPVQPKVRDRLIQQARDLGIADAVTLVPGVPHAQVLKAMVQASVFTTASLTESFALPPLEAMACGTPVVAPDVAYARETLADAALLVRAEEGGDVAAAYAIAWLGLLESPEVAATLSRRGLARAKHFTWPEIGARLNKAVTTLLKIEE